MRLQRIFGILGADSVKFGGQIWSQTIERVSGSRIRIALRFRDVYIWIALLLIVVNCLVKNLAMFVWHVDLLA